LRAPSCLAAIPIPSRELKPDRGLFVKGARPTESTLRSA
jgi:hypothetical protein